MPTPSASPGHPALPIPIAPGDDALRVRLDALCLEGWAIWERFAAGETDRPFHPFVAADYDAVRVALWPYRGCGLRFLEWGSATGVIAVMADLLGFESYGIELDSKLMATATTLAAQFASGATFATGSFLPSGYRWSAGNGDQRTGTLGSGPSGYQHLGHALDEFDVVFGYPWDGEAPMMLDLMQRYGRRDALLLLNGATTGVLAYRGGRQVRRAPWLPSPPPRG